VLTDDGFRGSFAVVKVGIPKDGSGNVAIKIIDKKVRPRTAAGLNVHASGHSQLSHLNTWVQFLRHATDWLDSSGVANAGCAIRQGISRNGDCYHEEGGPSQLHQAARGTRQFSAFQLITTSQAGRSFPVVASHSPHFCHWLSRDIFSRNLLPLTDRCSMRSRRCTWCSTSSLAESCSTGATCNPVLACCQLRRLRAGPSEGDSLPRRVRNAGGRTPRRGLGWRSWRLWSACS
jgi:hypothetical protein